MKCIYIDIECDWPETTGDIECSECVHYNKGIKAKKGFDILDWIIEKIERIFIKK